MHDSSWRKRALAWIEGKSATIWNHRLTTVALFFSSYAIAFYIWRKPQLPGVAAVVLGGIAAIMTFRDMHHTHKLLFTLAILLLVWLEFTDIRLDRKDSDDKTVEQISKQAKSFKEIRDAQDQSFQKTADGLRAAIARIDFTLQSANQIQEQTEPHAVMQFANTFAITNAPQAPNTFAAGG